MKTKKTRNKKTVGLTNKQVVRKFHRVNLKKKLQSIYNDEIDLSTTMTCKCTCCLTTCPSMNFSEFIQIITEAWKSWTKDDKTELICTSIEYFFKNEFEKWGIQTLVKPCMLLDKSTGLCKCYEDRPLSCRLFGIWPKDEYERRVSKFVKAYSKYGLIKEDLPLYFQCPLVERNNKDKELTLEIINGLYKKLDLLDKNISDFSDLQISQKHNYRSFHDWLLLKVFGEDWLSKLTAFMMSANKEQLEDQIEQINKAVREGSNSLIMSMEDKLEKDNV